MVDAASKPSAGKKPFMKTTGRSEELATFRNHPGCNTCARGLFPWFLAPTARDMHACMTEQGLSAINPVKYRRWQSNKWLKQA